jgi:hypothetical protein
VHVLCIDEPRPSVVVAVLAIACGRYVRQWLDRWIAAMAWSFQSAAQSRLPRITPAE